MPFLYSTNGEVIWHQDVRHELNRSREIAQFHTAEALKELFEHDIDDAVENLQRRPNDHPQIRPYQQEAGGQPEKVSAAPYHLS